MQYEICFLDQSGKLSCLMTAQFLDDNHASSFASHAMDTAASRTKLYSAEIHRDGERLVVALKLRAKRGLLKSGGISHVGGLLDRNHAGNRIPEDRPKLARIYASRR